MTALRTRRLTIPQRLRQGLVAYWPLAPSAAGAIGAADAHSALYDGRGPYDLTVVNSPERADGPSNNLPDAVGFVAASSQYLSHADVPALSLANTDFTISGWVYFTTLSTQAVLSKDNVSAGGREYGIILNSINRLTAETYDGSNRVGVVGQVTLSAETWYFFAARYNQSSRLLRMRVNATEHSATASADIADTATEFRIGGRADNNIFHNGRSTQIDIEKRELSDAEVDWRFNNGEGRSPERGV